MVKARQVEDWRGLGERVPEPWGSSFVCCVIFISFFIIQKSLIETCNMCDAGKTRKIRKENFYAK